MQNLIFEPSWKTQLQTELKKDYIKQLERFLLSEQTTGKCIYPKQNEYFKALELTPFHQVKVVILGQDPYHNPDQAHGLAFSVNANTKIPPSLMNIYKELESDLNIKPSKQGCLTYWAEQGVLLLNSVLTVEHQKPNAHQGEGWELLTDCMIQKLNQNRQNLVFILWGNYAKRKGKMINKNQHFILESAHPSPLSAYRGFFGSRPFSKTNQLLQSKKISPIDWCLPKR